MRCSLLKEAIPLLDTVHFEFSGNNYPTVIVTGIYTKNAYIESDPVSDIISLLASADVGLKLPTTYEKTMPTFAYQSKSNWTRYDIKINKQVYSLYQNKLTFGKAKATLTLSFIIKDTTSDSMTFYEDLVGQVLMGDDIRHLAWLLATGTTITGRRLYSVKLCNSLEKTNNLAVYNPTLQVETSNSKLPKLMYIIANDIVGVLDLTTVVSVKIRKKEDIIQIAFITETKSEYMLEFN